MMELNQNEKDVLQYLKAAKGKWVSPTEIGRNVGGGKRHSAWGSPICKRLVKKGFAKRHDCGWYSAV